MWGEQMVKKVKWGESGLAGRVGTKFRTLKTENRLHGRFFGGAERVFDASPECFRKSNRLLMQVSLCFWGSKLCPNSPRQSRLAPLYGTYWRPRTVSAFFDAHLLSSNSFHSRKTVDEYDSKQAFIDLLTLLLHPERLWAGKILRPMAQCSYFVFPCAESVQRSARNTSEKTHRSHMSSYHPWWQVPQSRQALHRALETPRLIAKLH